MAEEAIAFAGALSAPRRAGERTVHVDPALFEKVATDVMRKSKALEAPQACIEAVRAATELPFTAGLEREQALFQQFVASNESKALRHVFFAERAAAKIDGDGRAIDSFLCHEFDGKGLAPHARGLHRIWG